MLRDELIKVDASTSSFQPEDLKELVSGLRLLGGSFCMKIIYHVLTKTLWPFAGSLSN
jgi:hypothetical protein